MTGFWTRQAYNKPQRGASALTTPLSTWNEDDTFRIYQGIWNSILNDHAFLETRVSLVDIFFPLYDPGRGESGRQSIDHRVDDGQGHRRQQRTSKSMSGSACSSTRCCPGTKPSGWARRHELKFGWDFANNTTSVGRDGARRCRTWHCSRASGRSRLHLQHAGPSRRDHADECVLCRGHASSAAAVTRTLASGSTRRGASCRAQSSPAGTFTRRRAALHRSASIVDWKTLSPRGGVIYQLTTGRQDGLKFSAARYYHLMSTTIPSSANPNTSRIRGRRVAGLQPRFQVSAKRGRRRSCGLLRRSVDLHRSGPEGAVH